MHFLRTATLAFVAVMATTSLAHAGDAPAPRNFGTTNCHQAFSCANTETSQIAALANQCAVNGFGVAAAEGGIFDTASLDSNSCMVSQLPNNGNGKPASAQCCIIADGDSCTMYCQILVY